MLRICRKILDIVYTFFFFLYLRHLPDCKLNAGFEGVGPNGTVIHDSTCPAEQLHSVGSYTCEFLFPFVFSFFFLPYKVKFNS